MEPPPEPPRTPEIKVHQPPDEPEEEIQYIGVGLGTLSKMDKRPRNLGEKSASEPILHHRTSSDSIRSDRSDTSVTSGQLTPYEPMVYTSPLVTHENVFEKAFEDEEERLRAIEGAKAMIYNTWRSEEFKGEPISNEFGRMKVELERLNSDDGPRWEKILKEKFPERLAELYQRKEDRVHFLQGLFAHKLMRESGQHISTGEVEGPLPVILTQDITGQKVESLNPKGRKRLDALRSVMGSLKSGAAHDGPPTSSEHS
jgi:hypothetical protein